MLAPQQPESQGMAEVDYLHFEEASLTKHEFINGKVYAMTGASWNHGVIITNLVRAIGSQLAGHCNIVANDVRLKVQSRLSYRYPDVMLVCGAVHFVENRRDTIDNPILIIEVLSPTTALVDRNEKLREYRQLPSLQEYLLVAQSEARIERFLRHESGEWLYTDVSGLETSLKLPSIDVLLALSAVYHNIDFENEDME